MPPEIDLLKVDRGTVTAPAGCGKTHLIADALARHTASKPILVLTHTNAGVAALKGCLDRASVPTSAYRLATIDGWSMRLLTLFPRRSGHDSRILSVSDPRAHYPAILPMLGRPSCSNKSEGKAVFARIVLRSSVGHSIC